MIGVPERNCWAIESVDSSAVIRDARVYYRELYRAACGARKYIAFAGWQFDSEVQLLRGDDRALAETDEVRLLPFLEELCRRRPELQIHFLAWDFSVLYALEREWMQKWIFDWSTNERIRFRFDPHPALGGSHHQKFVIIDGVLAFAGGMDVCTGRWDDSDHRAENPDRVDLGNPHGPYHDVQAVFTGEAVGRLARLFQTRWIDSKGDKLDLSPQPGAERYAVKDALVLPARRVALSRTQSPGATANEPPIGEVRNLYTDAIAAAQTLIYIENQYFSARAVQSALEARMSDAGAPRLDIVFVLPERPEALKEELAIGLEQGRLLRRLRAVAAAKGHRLAVVCSDTYVHSKVLVVDDALLSIGSANTTNRSMGLDTELNLTWEAEPGAQGEPLRRAIQRVRVALLAEHAGVTGEQGLRDFTRADGLAERLDAVARSGRTRLRPHALETPLEQNALVQNLVPEGSSIDPDGSDAEAFEPHSSDAQSVFARGVRLLNAWLARPG